MSMGRRDFLRIGGTGLAGAVLLGSAAGGVLAQQGTLAAVPARTSITSGTGV